MIQIIAYLSPILFDSVVPLSGAVVPVGTSTNICPFSFLVPPLWLEESGLESAFALGKKDKIRECMRTKMANNTNN